MDNSMMSTAVVILAELIALVVLGYLHRARTATLKDLRESLRKDIERERRRREANPWDEEHPTPPPYTSI